MIFGWFGRNRKKESAALYAAVRAGDIAGIRDALQGKADINAIEPESGQAPLHAAVEQSQQAVVELLLAKGANPNIVSTGHATPLMIAAGLGDSALPLVSLLLAAKADPDLAPVTGSSPGGGPLHIAARNHANGVLGHLLAFGAQPKALPNGATLMHIAAMGGDVETVAIAQRAGFSADQCDNDGRTPLHWAATQGNADAATALCDIGVPVDTLDREGGTPLIHAALGNHIDVVDLLLRHGADPETVSGTGDAAMSPLLGAAIKGFDTVVKRLLDAGASPERRVGNLAPIIDLARQAGHLSTAALLERHGRPTRGVPTNASRLAEVLGDTLITVDRNDDRVSSILALSLIEFSDTLFPNNRFRNSVKSFISQGLMPFSTIGEYLEAGQEGRLALLRAPNLGTTSLVSFEKAIQMAISEPLATSPATANSDTLQTEPVAPNLADQVALQWPEIFDDLLTAYRNASASDLAEYAALSARLRAILEDSRAADVALRRYRGETLDEIGASLGLSRERVRQIEARFKPWMNKPVPPTEAKPQEPSVEDGLRASWRGMYERLKSYRDTHGDADVPHQWSDDPKLGSWVGNQRQKYKKGELLPEQIAKLEELGFVWSLRERGTWEDRIRELTEFKQRTGHFDVPTDYPAAPKLKQFISSTRFRVKEGGLDDERIAQLNEIGFIQQPAPVPTPAIHPEAPVAIDYSLPNGFSLQGRTLAITGRLEHFSRDEATLAAQSRGATVLDKMSGKVELLVVGRDAASKLDAARHRGIPIINETQFAALVGKDVSRDAKVGAGETAPINPA